MNADRKTTHTTFMDQSNSHCIKLTAACNTILTKYPDTGTCVPLVIYTLLQKKKKRKKKYSHWPKMPIIGLILQVINGSSAHINCV